MSKHRRVSRRTFLKHTATAAGVAAPYILRPGVLAAAGKPGANDRVGLGLIGTGRRGDQMLGDMRRVTAQRGEAQIIALSDIWPKKCHDYIKKYEEKTGKKGGTYAIVQDYRKLLESKDIDGVIVTTCDHWHALPTIHACQAGKDAYGEKPMTLTIREGRVMIDAVRKYKRVFQTGSQQRSMKRNRVGCELIRNGLLGKVHTVICQVYPSSKPCSAHKLPEEPVPEGMDWDMWCGQTPPRPFSWHVYLTYNKPGWQWLRPFSGGLTTNWGAHGLDMVQWALGTDDTGPVEVIPEGNKHNSPVTLKYAGGVVVKLCDPKAPIGGGIFIGEKGKLSMNRGKWHTEPKELATQPPKDPKVKLYWSDNHLQNWIDCIKSRKRCVADVEIGHRSATVCHLIGIARRLGRKLRWDPARELFVGDTEANALIDRPKRKPYDLPDPV